MRKKVLFISSTGGHLSELMQLAPLFSKYDIGLITEKTESTLYLQGKYPGKVDFLVYGSKDHMLIYPFKLLYNCIKSIFLFYKYRPQVVITTGTHTAVPMCYIAKMSRKKVVFIESFCMIESRTISGRMIYPIADLFVVQWESMKSLYPKAVYLGGIY